jgi:serine/threonine-protein kinase
MPPTAPPAWAAATLPATPARRGRAGALPPGARGGAAAGADATPGAAGQDPPADLTVGATRYLARAHPLRMASGRVVGGYAVLRARDLEYAAFAALRRATLAAGGVGLLAALLVSFALARGVTRPLATLTDAARRAAEGDFAVPFTARTGGRDEVGVLASAFQTLLDDLHAKQVLVEFARLSRGRVPSGRQRAVGAGRRLTPPRGAAAAAAAVAAESTIRFGVDGAASAPGAAVPSGGPDAAGARPDVAPDLLPGDPADGAPVDAIEAAEALRPGQLFAERYLMEAMIGAGGSGVVFRVQDAARGGEPVALKVLRPDVAQHDPGALARLARELETTRQLAHPNVVRTFDLGEAEGIHFMTMEYVEGRSLRELIDERGPLPVAAAVSAARQLCRALAHAHARGVLHRDVKPHNAVITPDGCSRSWTSARRASPRCRGGDRDGHARRHARLHGPRGAARRPPPTRAPTCTPPASCCTSA